MPVKNLHVKLEGKSQLHEPIIKLEDIKINIWSIDGGVTWENKGVKVQVNGPIDIYMSCKAISGTEWSFFVEDKDLGKKIYEEEGETGEHLKTRGDARIPNFSERKESV